MHRSAFRRRKATRTLESDENLHVPLAYVCESGARFVGARFDPLPGHALTLSEILDLYVETPAAGQPGPRMWQSWPNHCSPCIYVLKIPKQIERSTRLPSYRDSYRGRRSRAPGLGFRRRKTTGASESHENLHVPLGYVCESGARLLSAMCRPHV